MNHRERSTSQIADAIGKIGVVPIDKSLITEAPILTEWNLAPQKVAQRIRADKLVTGPHHLRDRSRPYYVSARFTHLAFLNQHPAGCEDFFGQSKLSGHQERGPVDSVESQDILPDQVKV